MALSMSRPIKAASSSMLRLKTRVPVDIRDRVKGRKIELPIGHGKQVVTIGEFVEASLQTRDPHEAKARHSAALSAVLRYWSAVREGPKPLTHKQATALAGIIYREEVDRFSDEKMAGLVKATEWFLDELEDRAHSPERMRELVKSIIAAGADLSPITMFYGRRDLSKLRPMWDWYEMLEAVHGATADHVLAREGLVIDPESRRLLLDCIRDAVLDVAKDRARKVQGDYSPDPKANRFPQPSEAKPNARPKLSITGLFAEYVKMLQAGGQGFVAEKRWTPLFTKFAAFLKHDDATRVTKADIIAWKEQRLITEGRSPKTVRDSDLAALKAVFKWAAGNLKLPIDPTDGVKVRLSKQVKTRSKGFTDGEASGILKAALEYRKPEKEYDATAAAKRWAPWLCAFTGARIAEICQLRKEDFSDHDGVPIIRITPDAGSVKSGHYRDVPLHPQLVEIGLLDFVAASSAGPLFHRTKPRSALRKGSGAVRGLTSAPPDSPFSINPASAVAATVAEWVNSLGVIDGKVAPNHGWRHRFKTVAIEVGMNQRAADALQDHAARTAGEAYGDVTLKAKYTAINMLPRYPVRDTMDAENDSPRS